MRKIVAGKLHGIHVTEGNLDYHGSVTLDPDHCEEAGIVHSMLSASRSASSIRASSRPSPTMATRRPQRSRCR